MRGLAEPRLATGLALAAALALSLDAPAIEPVVLPSPSPPPPSHIGPMPPRGLLLLEFSDAPSLPLVLPEVPATAAQAYLALDAPELDPSTLQVVTRSGGLLPLLPGPRPGLLVGMWTRQQLAEAGPPIRVEARGRAARVIAVAFGFAGGPRLEPHSSDHLRVLLAWWRATPSGHPARAALAELLCAQLLRQQLPDTGAARRRLVELALDALEELPSLSPAGLPPALRPLFADLEEATRARAWTHVLGDADPREVASRVAAFAPGSSR